MAGVLDAIKAELGGTSLTVQGYSIPLPINFEHVEPLFRGKKIVFVRSLLGASWRKWKLDNKTQADLDAFIADLFKALGLDPDDAWRSLALLDDDDTARHLEADLHDLGVNLTDFVAGRMTFRRFCILASGLRDTSRVNKHLAGKPGEWDTKEYMLADLIDLLNFNNLATHVQAQSMGLTKPLDFPKALWKRPGVEEKKEEIVFATAAQLRAMLF